MNGIELCRRIRQTDSTTPILFYSGRARESERNEGMRAGATEYLVKPNDLEKLVATVRRLLDQSRSISTGESLVKLKAFNCMY